MDEYKYSDTPPFTPQRLQEERDKDKSKVVPVRLNKEQLARLEADAKFIEQEKISTALKTLAEIGSIVLHDPLMGTVVKTLFKNKQLNKRTGIVEVEPDFQQM